MICHWGLPRPTEPEPKWIAEKARVLSGRQDAVLYGSQDGRRYAEHSDRGSHVIGCGLRHA
ncbi:MAG: hypothetical protein DME21_05580 [Verrucomicrobia bacterium]|nr:MAG: hypothetical protein DME21_05580 [Verrucomicrobiota bacterium]